jgi:hypothetical protein
MRGILCPSFTRRRLQPRRTTIIFDATRVTANLFPARPLVAGWLESRGHDSLGSDGGRRLGSRINRKGRPAKRASHDQVNWNRNGKVRARSKEAGGSPGYGDSLPFGHLLHLRTAQVPRCQLRFLALVSWLGGGRLGLSLGAGQTVPSLFWVRRLRGGRTSLWRLWQIHGRGSLSSSSGSGGYVESYAPRVAAGPASPSSSLDQSLRREGLGNLLKWSRGSPESTSSSFPSSP